MREKLNENPMAQVGLVVILIAVVGYMLLGKGGGEEEIPEEGAVIASVNGVTATGATPGEAVEGAVEGLEAGAVEAGSGEMPTSVPAPPPPAPVTAAYEAGRTVVLLVVHDGGIDRSLTAAATAYVADVPGTELFVVPVRQLARYASITVGLDLNRVPALVVMRPRGLSDGIPQATVDYGFQTPASVVQAVRDASYAGPETTYHPD